MANIQSTTPGILNAGPAIGAEAIDISAADHTFAAGQASRALYVGGTGVVIARLVHDSVDTTFSAVPAGSVLPLALSQVTKVGTTATLMVALF